MYVSYVLTLKSLTNVPLVDHTSGAKMDSSGGTSATTAMEYVYGGTADWRTDLYQYPCPEVVTHKEYIKLVQSLGRKFTPELKTPSVDMPFNGMTQEDYGEIIINFFS